MLQTNLNHYLLPLHKINSKMYINPSNAQQNKGIKPQTENELEKKGMKHKTKVVIGSHSTFQMPIKITLLMFLQCKALLAMLDNEKRIKVDFQNSLHASLIVHRETTPNTS